MSVSHPSETNRPEELFAAFRTGNEAFTELLESHRDYLLKIVSSQMPTKLRARAGASDVVQDALLSVLKTTTNGLFAVRSKDDLTTWGRKPGRS